MAKRLWEVSLILFVVIIIIELLSPKGNAKTVRKSEYYPNAGIVFELDEPNDLVYFRTFNGHEWSFEGIEDWMIGDIVAVIFDDKGTESIFDDEIVKVRYIGYAY